MGIWPWLALAEVAQRRQVRVLAMGAAGLIAAIAVTTQARALVPAFVVTTALVMIAAPGRTRRALHLLIVAAAILISAHWTLAIYSSTGPAQQYAPPSGVLRDAGIAIVAGGLLAAGLKLALERLASRCRTSRRERSRGGSVRACSPRSSQRWSRSASAPTARSRRNGTTSRI